MEEDKVTGNGFCDANLHRDSPYSTLNGKRSPEDSPMTVDNTSSFHHAAKRPKNDINGYDHLPTNTLVGGGGEVCNGQPQDSNHKHNQPSVEPSKRLTESPMPSPNTNQVTQSAPLASSLPKTSGPDGDSVTRDPTTESTADSQSGSVAEAALGESEPEVITLSDSEDELREVLSQAIKLSLSCPKTIKMLRRRQQKLRIEESKLILLKKLRESMSYQHRPSASEGATKSDVRSAAGQMVTGQKSSGNVPPPLKRGSHQSSGHHAVSNSNKVSGHHGVSQPVPSGHSGKQMSAAHALHTSSGHSSTGPPPLVNMAKNPPNQSNGSALSYSQSTSASTKKATAAPAKPPQLTAEQKLGAAKLILKKQLEQSLQQIPTPKPPPPEVNFLPSLASGEFVYLLGMEEVVKNILTLESKETKYVVNPFTCVQCNTDFTPVWKRDKPGSKNVICEKCISTKHKRSMRKEHTAKLKATFSKALQNERDIERRINAGSPLSDMPGLNAYAAANTINHHHHQQQRNPSNASPAPSTPSMPQLTAQQQSATSVSSHHTSATSSGGSSQLTSAQLQQHQQALIQAQAAEQMRAMLAAQAMALPYQLYGVSNKQAAELQRQYLLDMINPSRSWKT